jgi:hypothetical protein
MTSAPHASTSSLTDWRGSHQFVLSAMPSLILCPAVQVAEKERSEVDNEALALSLSTTNAYFLAVLVLATFFVLRNSSPVLNYAGSTLSSGAVVLYLALRAK